ncbi:heparinase II/III family protein [Enterovirga rhinocerotis]|uniref:Heparinase II/III-like protein n=1 Tax=Enterovirga rhinocerotis TaxID=1339210 RepID=A0A4R7C913_9HYPH|nr:heparinase II/III-family protein [Enterovirga rhinocerotis]TDR93197.1 heparinase II/III-like protein [Enterovirga rhinocerotis]
MTVFMKASGAKTLEKLTKLATSPGPPTRDEVGEARSLLQRIRALPAAGNSERQQAVEAFGRIRESYAAEVERRRVEPAAKAENHDRAIGKPSEAIRIEPDRLSAALAAVRGRPLVRRTRSALIESDFGVFGGVPTGGAESVIVAVQEAEGWKARSDTLGWVVPDPIDWSADPFGDKNWVAQFHGWRLMNVYLRAYSASRDPEMLRRIVPWMVAWAQYRRDLAPDRHNHVDPQSGMRSTGLAVVLDSIRRGELVVSAEDEVALHDLALDQVAWLAGGNIAYMNHAYYQIIGLELMCRVLDDEPWAPLCRDHVAGVFEEFLASQFTDEGVHVENSPSYHFYAISQIMRGNLGSLSDKAAEIVARADEAYPWFVLPHGRLATIGDTSDREDPVLADARDHVRVVGDATYAVAPFWSSGYAVVRSLPDVPPSDASMLILAGTSRTHIHSHADKLSFILFERGQQVLIDTGKYGYTRDPMRSYVESAAAHNTVGLATTDIGRLAFRLGSASLDAPRVEGDEIVLGGEVEWTPHRYADFAFGHRRELRYAPGRHLTIHDTLRSDTAMSYASRLHLARDIELVREGPVFTGRLLDGTGLRIECLEPDAEIRTYRGSMDPVRGWETVDYLKMEPATTLEAVCSGDDRVIRWTVSFLPAT